MIIGLAAVLPSILVLLPRMSTVFFAFRVWRFRYD
jgi:hypothetical protein